MLKIVSGYDIEKGVTAPEYEEWLWKEHLPDLLQNPHLDRIVLDTPLRQMRPGLAFYKISELHFQSMDAYQRYLDWFAAHPMAEERGPRGRTDFKFSVLCEVHEVDRESLAGPPAEKTGRREVRTPGRGRADAKGVLGYDIMPGLTVKEYEDWLWDIHAPDLLANPYLLRVSFNTVIRPVREGMTFYRTAELQYESLESYQQYLDWLAAHPVPVERTPQGRTDFKFYLQCTSREVDRQNLSAETEEE